MTRYTFSTNKENNCQNEHKGRLGKDRKREIESIKVTVDSTRHEKSYSKLNKYVFQLSSSVNSKLYLIDTN